MRSTERRHFPHRRGLIIVMTLATAYVASHFFRASNVTIGLDLMRDLSIGPEALGGLTGAFFFGFAAMQIPCGFFFDRFGPRRTVVGMLVLATIGGIVFTLAPTWPILLTGRMLMGAGFGVMLIGSMVVISRWFPPDRFSTLTAMVLSIGLLGNLAATTPLAWASQAIGWRVVFAAAVAFTALATIAVWMVVRDAPPGHPFLARTPEPPRQMLQGLMEVLRNPRLKPILALNFCNYACTFTVQGLWGGPFLREVHGLSAIEAGNVLFIAVIAYQVGMLTFGPLDRLLDTRKWIAFGGTLVIICILATLAFASQPPVWVPDRRHHRRRLFQCLQHHGDDACPWHFSGPADRSRHRDDQHCPSCSASRACRRFPASSSALSSPWPTARALRPPIAPSSACSPWCSSSPSRSTAARRTSSPATKCAMFEPPITESVSPQLRASMVNFFGPCRAKTALGQLLPSRSSCRHVCSVPES